MDKSYWESEEGKKTAEIIGKAGMTVLEHATGLKDPTGSASQAAGQFAKQAMPQIADKSEKMMSNVYKTNQTAGDKFKSEHFLRDDKGNWMSPKEFEKQSKDSIVNQLKSERDVNIGKITKEAEKQYTMQDRAMQKGDYNAAQEHKAAADNLMQQQNKVNREYNEAIKEVQGKSKGESVERSK